MASLLNWTRGARRPAPNPADQLGTFQNRLRRVNAGSTPRNVIWVGTDQAYAMPNGQLKPRRTRLQTLKAFISRNFLRLLLLAIGFTAHGAVSIVRFHMQGLAQPFANPDLEMAIQVATAFTVTVIAGRILGVGLREMSFWKLLGALAGVTLFHNLVHLYPDTFATIAPSAWLKDIMANTTANSLFWRGTFYPL